MTTTGRTLIDFYDALFAHYGPQHWWPARTREEVIIGAILTQNTAWRNVERAIDNLRRSGYLDFARLHAVEPAHLAELVRPSGTYRVKAKRLKAFVGWLFARFDGDLDAMFATPMHRLREALLEVTGVGRETADAILLYAGHMPGFVVDTYTHRVLHRHGLIDVDADYDEIKALFEGHLPAEVDLFNEYHALLVAVGKTHCRPKARCAGCPLECFDHQVESVDDLP